MLVSILKTIKDHRSYHGKEYQLWQILLFSIFAILCNAKTYQDIETFIKVHYDILNETFRLNWRVKPTLSGIRRIIIGINPEDVEEAFRIHAANAENAYQTTDTKHLCFDGKSLNGSFSHTKQTKASQVFSVFAAHSKLVLAHIPVGIDKDHEIQAFQKLIEELNLNEVIITADALHCQKKHLKQQKMLAQS